MATDVIMPQMGESIFEGTITKWLKKPGDKVQRDEPLFEISTDKVDAEIPSPAAGVLKEIKVSEGATVQVNTVVGVIEAEGAPAAASTKPAAAPAPPPQPAPAARAAAPQPPAPPMRLEPAAAPDMPAAPPRRQAEPAPVRERVPAPAARDQQPAARHGEGIIEFPQSEEEGAADRHVRSSPLVRRIARDQNVDLNQVEGTGLGGRITKEDILRFVEQRGQAPAQARPAPAAAAPAYQPAATAAAIPATAPAPSAAPAPVAIPGQIVPMTPMRKKIAERMVESKRISAHVYSVYEVDMTRVMAARAREKESFEQRTGARLTVMPFFCRAAIHALRQFPIINASVESDNIHYHQAINLGIAVALDWGLIVPVIKNADEKNFLGLQRSILDLADRARSRKLVPDEVAGGTFTITNPGQYGQMFGLPIILQPQVAIMGVAAIKKQPVVITNGDGVDSIAIRSICHLSLAYDHRVIDGAIADQFLRSVAQYLEAWNEPLA